MLSRGVFKKCQDRVRLASRHGNGMIMHPIRQFWVPLMIAGAAVVVGSTVVKYVNASMRKSESEDASTSAPAPESAESDSNDNDHVTSAQQTQSRSATRQPNFTGKSIGVDIGSSFSKVSIFDRRVNAAAEASPHEVKLSSAHQVLENGEGRRHTSTAIYISPSSSDDENEFMLGHFAKAKRFLKSDRSLYGVHADLLMPAAADDEATLTRKLTLFGEFRRILPLSVQQQVAVYSSNAAADAGVGGSRQHDADLLPSLLFASMVQDMVANVAQHRLQQSDNDGNDSHHSAGNGRIRLNVSLPNGVSHEQQENIAVLTEEQLLASPALHAGSVGGGPRISRKVNYVPDAVSAVAGALSMGLLSANESDDNNYVCVVDVGGQLVQLSVVKWRKGEDGQAAANPTLVSHRTICHCGVDAIDDAVVAQLAGQFARKVGIDVLQDAMAKQRLYDAVETARVELCVQFKANLSVPFITADSTGPVHFNETLTRQQFDVISALIVEKMEVELYKLLEDFNTQNSVKSSDSPSTESLRESRRKSVAQHSQSLPHTHAVASYSADRYFAAPQGEGSEAVADGHKVKHLLFVGGGCRIPLVTDMLSSKETVLPYTSIRAVKSDDGGSSRVIVPQSPEELVCVGSACVDVSQL